jgi:hypothetical protein
MTSFKLTNTKTITINVFNLSEQENIISLLLNDDLIGTMIISTEVKRARLGETVKIIYLAGCADVYTISGLIGCGEGATKEELKTAKQRLAVIEKIIQLKTFANRRLALITL